MGEQGLTVLVDVEQLAILTAGPLGAMVDRVSHMATVPLAALQEFESS